MTARAPLVRPALGFLAGVVLGLEEVRFPAGALLALPLALSPPLAPVAFGAAGWLLAASGRAAPEVAAPAVPLEGRIVSVPEHHGDRVLFRLRTADGALLEVAAPPAEWPLSLGDEVRLTADLRPPPGPRNPGGRDAASRLAASGVA